MNISFTFKRLKICIPYSALISNKNINTLLILPIWHLHLFSDVILKLQRILFYYFVFYKYGTPNLNHAISNAIIAIGFSYSFYFIIKLRYVKTTCPHCGTYYSLSRPDISFDHQKTYKVGRGSNEGSAVVLVGVEHEDRYCYACETTFTNSMHVTKEV